jgi:hypothetical protein
VFALGLYLGLRKLAMGIVLASHAAPELWWASFEGLIAVCGGQIVAVVFGAILAAAGRTGGFVFGASVGGLCGALFLGAELLAGAPTRDLFMYIQPGVLGMVGGVAGVFASRIWGAIPAIDMPVPDRSRLSSSRFMLNDTGETARPTAWLRIIAGAFIIMLAVTAADEVRSKMQKHSDGLLRVTSQGQGQFLTWQFAVFGVLAGSALAGAGTGAGVRHGIIAGAIGGAGVLGIAITRGESQGPINYWLNKLALNGLPPTDPAAAAAALGGVLFLGIIGGWLGGTLFQPLAPEAMRKRVSVGMD